MLHEKVRECSPNLQSRDFHIGIGYYCTLPSDISKQCPFSYKETLLFFKGAERYSCLAHNFTPARRQTIIDQYEKKI